jgi:hypothetical protein
MRFASFAAKPFLLKLGAFGGLAAFTHYFFIVLCGVYFQCGCRAWHAGAATHCNIHLPHAPHCPFCVLPPWQFEALILLVIAGQGYLAWRGRWVLAAIAFPVLTGIESLVLGWYRGYWS